MQLHVSENLGASWKLAAHVKPDAGRFTYRAMADGQYWFMVRTVDGSGRLQPAAPPQPELKVQVDTKMPTLEVEASRGEAGEVVVRWRAVDANLSAESLKISYQPLSSNIGWQPVAIDMMRLQHKGDVYSGETTWWPDASHGPIAIRADVADRAGNRTYNQTEVGPPPMTAMPLVERLPVGEPIAAGRPEVGPLAPWQTQVVATPPQPTMTQQTATQQTAESLELPPAMPSAFPISNPSEPRTGKTVREPEAPVVSEVMPLPPVMKAAPTIVESLPPTIVESLPPLPPPASTVISVEPSRETVAINQLPEPVAVVASKRSLPPLVEPARPVALPPVEQSSTVVDPSHAPPGIRPRMVNQTTFEMAYDVSAVGPEGLARVELWGTRDGGRSWNLMAVDDDNRSPIVVGVDGQGWYGFNVVVQSGLGLRSPQPNTGDLPEVWVVVDTAPPVATLTVSEPGSESPPGVLAIRWEVDDESLGPQPISLWFRSASSDPWTTLAAGLANTGHYDWQLDRRAPEQLFIRLEVHDDAGNVTNVETPKPIIMTRLRPQGRILDVRPAVDAAK